MIDLQNLKQPSVAIKAAEVVLLFIAVSIFAGHGTHWTYFAMSTMLGSLLNAIVLLGCFLLGYMQIQKTPFELVLNVYYTLAVFVSSILLMASGYSLFVASGVFCLFLTFFYGVDVYFTYLNVANRPTSFPPASQPAGSSQGAQDTVDTAANPNNVFVTNPTYPSTMNYPPSTVTYPPTVTSPPTVYYPPPEYPANSPIGPKP
ncbi:uncharacterized protein LOC125029037 [Penaeus chinensis]|uniref:uncharacterized protein LOC125029037 n=1 Tax=Penaeus chinensis TaxID=139456 RepID=UPI001FB74284|nr:uncharacterized protein LOC125029037 [Penaeus chinensis]XP_047474723.1 uncharacterized protein LOC125029037 [Penaeus chinensis]XP_047474724.1 uncharacterized protein LOC125029037 [Penaeus chinensis]XP_047474725.1 uncharacterized protein LOC125029037 [Penaeus chinensis]XP_047474726.1 uncharacterized protein LOC125029037 [Penaeus chinensis]